jgi:hypothetical protein
MGKPRFLAENFFSVAQFPLHVVSASAPVAGNEAFRVGTARRGSLNFYARNPPTAEAVVNVTLDRVRSADMCIIDRNSALAGRQLLLEVSSDNFATVHQPVSVGAMPIEVVYGSSLLDSTHAIRTSEGAWVFRFPETAGLSWRVRGFGDVISGPTFGGIYLGKSYEPENPVLPHDDESRYADFGEIRRGLPDNDQRYGRSGSFSMKMTNEEEWSRARLTCANCLRTVIRFGSCPIRIRPNALGSDTRRPSPPPTPIVRRAAI